MLRSLFVAEKRFEDGEFEELASELRQAVGREFRWEAEDVEQLTDQQRRRRQTIGDVAHEAMSRGDVVLVDRGEVRHRGVIVSVNDDLAVLETGDGIVNANLDGAMLAVSKRARSGGTVSDRGSRSFRARLAELEHTGEPVIIEGFELELRGRITVAATDHVALADHEGVTWHVPHQRIWFVIQPRS